MTPFMKNPRVHVKSLIASWSGDKKTPFWLTGIKNRKESLDKIDEILQVAVENKIHILVLPELTVDGEMLEHIRAWLRDNNRENVSAGKDGILLVVAGSFHFPDINSDKRIYNLSTVLNHGGRVICTQKKLKRYAFGPRDIQTSPELVDILKTSDKGGYENIHETDVQYCLDTPVGRIAVCICIDYFHPDHQESWRLSGINLFLTPAMTPGTRRFRDVSRLLGASNLAASFIANSGWAAKKQQDGGIHRDGACFYYLPDKKQNVIIAGENETLLIFDLGLLTRKKLTLG